MFLLFVSNILMAILTRILKNRSYKFVMRKLIILSILFLSLKSYANSPFGPTRQPFGKNLFYIDLFGGAVVPSMIYSDKAYDSFNRELFLNKTGGLAARMQFGYMFSIAPQISYAGKGVGFAENEYQLRVNYLNFYLPFEFEYDVFGFDKKVCTKMIFFAGPYAGYVLNGRVLLKGVVVKEFVSADLGQYDFGAETGIGLRIPTFSANSRSSIVFRISYYRGFADTYPNPKESFTVEDRSKFMISDSGTRTNQGIKATFSIEFPLAGKSNTTFVGGGDGKKTFKRFANIK